MRTLSLFRRAMAVGAMAVAFSLVGCGKPEPVNENHTGELTNTDSVHTADNSFYDEYKFKAAEGWAITITMESSAFDSYLQLRREDMGDEYLQEADDIAPGNLNAQITVTAPATDTYVVWANSRDAGATGAYTLRIAAAPAAAAQ